jgi:hypothetical protein
MPDNLYLDHLLGLPTFQIAGVAIPVAKRRPKLNLIGSGVAITGLDNPTENRIDLTLTAAGGAGDAESLLGTPLAALVGTAGAGQD